MCVSTQLHKLIFLHNFLILGSQTYVNELSQTVMKKLTFNKSVIALHSLLKFTKFSVVVF